MGPQEYPIPFPVPPSTSFPVGLLGLLSDTVSTGMEEGRLLRGEVVNTGKPRD